MTTPCLQAWRDSLGAERVRTDDGTLQAYRNNVCDFRRTLACVLRPRTVEDVQALVRTANRHNASLHPISRGRNWGMGSRLPPRDGAAIVDLGDLNRIREVNAPMRYAVVEAGVTQSQLYAHLCEHGLPLMMNVTGSTGDTSLVGNALDRGVGYFSSRATALSGLEVVLGTGELIRTGFGHYAGAATTHLYRHGLGPSLDGLFAQGNFGIVTAAGFELLPRPAANLAFIVRLEREEQLPPLIDALAALRREGAIETVVHVANRERSEITLAPLLYEQLQALGIDTGADPRAYTEAMIRREGFGPWSAVGGVPGSGGRRRWACARIRAALRGKARLLFLSGAQMVAARRLLGAFAFVPWFRRKLALVNAVEPVSNLALGIPADATLKGVYGPLRGEYPGGPDPDQSRCGMLYCLPVLPARGDAVRECLAETRAIFARHGFTAYLTVNLLDDRSLEGVISLTFHRDDPGRAEAARTCIREAEAYYLRAGWPPYRVGIESFDLVVRPDDPYWKTVRDLKLALDPNHIISPGRYNLV